MKLWNKINRIKKISFLIFIIFVEVFIINTRENPREILFKEYEPLIQYAQEYKAKHDRYPEKIDIQFKPQKFSNYKYRTFNDGKDFKICVDNSDKLLSDNSARYCTGEGIYGCEVYEWGPQDIKNKWSFEEYADCQKD